MRRTRHSRVSLLFDTRGRRSGNDVQYIKLFSQTSSSQKSDLYFECRKHFTR